MTTQSDPELTLYLYDLFSNILSTPPKRRRRGWKDQLEQDLNTELTNDSARIFYEHGGAKVWLAYWAAKPTKSHCMGKSHLVKSFSMLDNLSVEDKTAMASMLASVQPHERYQPQVDEVVAMISGRGEASTGGQTGITPKRQRVDDDILNASTPPPQKRRPQESATYHHEDQYPLQHRPQESATYHYEDQYPLQRRPEGSVTHQEGAHYTDFIEFHRLIAFVPRYLSGAIRRSGTKSGVTMSTMKVGLPWIVSFNILDEKVDYFAKELYNAHLEREGPYRVLFYERHGRSARVGGHFTFDCCSTEPIPEIFGKLFVAGNSAAPDRLTDPSEDITRTVTMSGFNQIGDGAVISMSLGPAEGSEICDKLFS